MLIACVGWVPIPHWGFAVQTRTRETLTVLCGPSFSPRTNSSGRYVRAGFTMIDLLVSISVIAVLISLLLPSLAKVNETARRVVCQSNLRQVGLGVIMYADENKGEMPFSRFLPSGSSMSRALESTSNPQEMITLRVPDSVQSDNPWDGLGLLFAFDYLPTAKVFYCPSHTGSHPYSRYAQNWGPQEGGEVVCNFHFRGEGPVKPDGMSRAPVSTRKLYLIDPAQSSLIADGMQVRSDYNHKVGANFFRADLTVHWFDDAEGTLLASLPNSKNESSPAMIRDAWHAFDASSYGSVEDR